MTDRRNRRNNRAGALQPGRFSILIGDNNGDTAAALFNIPGLKFGLGIDSLSDIVHRTIVGRPTRQHRSFQ